MCYLRNEGIMLLKGRSGFTLIELSVVIVIIGLIVAGVTAGASLVEQAKQRQVIFKLDEYRSGVNKFFLVYNQLPGDFNLATSYWSDVADGDSDGNLEYSEGPHAFEHMKLANIIEGNFDGTNRPTPLINAENENVRYHFDNNDTWYQNVLDNVNILAIARNGCCGYNGAAVNVIFAEKIDRKIDDGAPRTGKVTGDEGNGGSGSVCETGANYNLSQSWRTYNCIMGFALDKR